MGERCWTSPQPDSDRFFAEQKAQDGRFDTGQGYRDDFVAVFPNRPRVLDLTLDPFGD